MRINENSTIAELRNDLERKRRRAHELQLDTTDPDEWADMNTLRWELEDLDKDLYLSQFIKNNDKITKLVGHVQGASEDAQKLVKSIESVEQAIKEARYKLSSMSSTFDEITTLLNDVEETIELIKA